jgi:hypothetical protein
MAESVMTESEKVRTLQSTVAELRAKLGEVCANTLRPQTYSERRWRGGWSCSWVAEPCLRMEMDRTQARRRADGLAQQLEGLRDKHVSEADKVSTSFAPRPC